MLCEEWLEAQWVAGTPLGVCGVHFYWPQSKGFLNPPVPRLVCRALISYFLELDEPCMAFLLALGFHTYLPTGEC